MFTSPSAKKLVQILEPPELIKGSGIPVTGIKPATIPTLIRMCESSNAATPMQMYIPARYGAVCAF